MGFSICWDEGTFLSFSRDIILFCSVGAGNLSVFKSLLRNGLPAQMFLFSFLTESLDLNCCEMGKILTDS